MNNKVRVLVNVYVDEHIDGSLFQFNRAVPVIYYHAIVAFLKDSPLVKNAIEEDLHTVKLITISCSNDKNALTILHGLEGCIKNSFFDEITRKKNSTSEELHDIAESLHRIADRFEDLVEENYKKENNGKLD